MAKVKLVEDAGASVPVISCPGCGSQHYLHPKDKPNHLGASWGWNGSMDKPTFSPSIHVKAGPWPEEFREEREGRGLGAFDICHSWVVDGRIRFLDDCTHERRGQIMDLPDWPETPA